MFCACIAVHMDQGMLVYTNRTYDIRIAVHMDQGMLVYTNRTSDIRMTTTTHLIQMMTPSQGVEMSVTTTHGINQHTHLFQSLLFHIKQKVN